MSLVRYMVRKTAVEAIRAASLYTVRDSSMAPVDMFEDGQTAPVIMVFTDEAKGRINNCDFLGKMTQSLIFEAAITQKTKLPTINEQGQLTTEDAWARCASDADSEFELDLLCRDIQLGLNDPNNEWALLFKDLIGNTQKCEFFRGQAGPEQDRFAARQIVLEVDLPKEPSRLEEIPLGSFWDRFITLAETLEDGDKIVKKVRHTLLIPSDEILSEEEQLRGTFGLTKSDGEALEISNADYELTGNETM